VTAPNRLVDITHLSGLDRIEELPDGGLRIGALIRNADLAHDPNFARRFPAVAEALLSSASAQLRNAATVGGNSCSERARAAQITLKKPSSFIRCRGQSGRSELSFRIFARNAGSWLSPR
jgi:CO/xanthine dehydrogenase FAD-binding subunit